MSVNCAHCYKQLDLKPEQKIQRNEECPHCGRDLKCCLACKFYDQNAYNECKEPNAERITEKEKANFCDYFVLGTGSNIGESKNDLLDAAKNLFKN